jgi:hypothetical protein
MGDGAMRRIAHFKFQNANIKLQNEAGCARRETR